MSTIEYNKIKQCKLIIKILIENYNYIYTVKTIAVYYVYILDLF